jgi:phosphoglycerate dehydrogenase-like enzyme
MTYALLRGVVRADSFVRAGRWQRERIAATLRVGGRIMGIVGFGRIGRHVARRAAGVGMEVLYNSRKPAPDMPHGFVADLHELAERADVLVLACPGGSATRGLVTRGILECLGPDGFLVNVSRGEVVDEGALLDALESRTIGGAGLDVFESEPNINSRFLPLENVVLSPHSASITRETRAAIIARLIADIDAFLAGHPFHDVTTV